MSFSKQTGFLNIIFLFFILFLAATVIFVFYLSQKKPDEPVSLMKSMEPSATASSR